MANGYDEHSEKVRAMAEAASSSDAAPMVAVRDKRYSKNGIGFRSQANEAGALDPAVIGVTPPSIMYPDGYAGGTAARKRGQVDEAKLPWETAQEATSRPDKPRATLPPFSLDEALPPWLKDKKGKGDEDEDTKKGSGKGGKGGKKSLPPWLKDKGEDKAKESARPSVMENWLDGEGPECEGFPDEEDAREALSTLAQFVDGDTLKSIQNQISDTYGDPVEPAPVDPQGPVFP